MAWVRISYFRSEGGEDAAHRHAGVAGDLADRRALVALGVEQLARRVHDAVSGGFLLRLTHAGRRRRLGGAGGGCRRRPPATG